MKKGILVMTDGLDGSGNGAIIRGLKDWADEKELLVFDLVEYCKKHKELPFFEETKDYDVILSAEPTYAWFGLAIRNEIVRQKNYTFSALSTAHAYSLDRKVLFKRVLAPFINKGGFVFQQRGVVSSLAYQPVQSRFQKEKTIDIDEIMNLPGNKFVLDNYPPDVLIFTKCSAEVCLDRLKKREKQDDSFFEVLNFQKELEKVYASEWLRSIFEKRGTKVIYLDTNPPLTEADTRKMARKILKEYLTKSYLGKTSSTQAMLEHQ